MLRFAHLRAKKNADLWLTCTLQVSWVRHWEALLCMMFDTLSDGLPPHHMIAAHVHGTM